ncbi:MAG: tryptophan synthase subunit alpha [Armatimonadetes bacterium]|nr:tryptophan synthase subunit alpha [Armatimonadota bacterium]
MTIHDKFSELRQRGEKALVCFFTAGDQPLEDLPAIVALLESSGADVIEIGIPFSDPFGEGPTIQASSQRALDQGVTLTGILEAIAKCNASIPLVTMGYYNPILRFGLDDFAKKSKEVGSTGTIVSDLVPDEAGEWDKACAANGIETIYLVAPTSTDERINQVAGQSTGFVYVVSRTGVTGAESAVPPEISQLVRKVKALTDKPACVGFGISTPDHVRLVCREADGAVVGSAVVAKLHQHWGHPDERSKIAEYIRSLKDATA